MISNFIRANTTYRYAFGTKNSLNVGVDSSGDKSNSDSLSSVDEALKGVDLNGACSFNFQNLSGKKVRVYIDGEFVGRIRRKGQVSVAVQNGIREVYCIAKDGTVWDKKVVCNNFTEYSIYKE